MNTLNKRLTDSFLNEFDAYWNDMLTIINCQQIQLLQGNRLRPQICLWGYLATYPSITNCDKTLSTIASVSVSIEMIHKASIMLDDWLDGDLERHGVPAFHFEYSPQNAVLTALTIIGLSLKRLKTAVPNAPMKLPNYYFMCLDTLIETICAMAQGALKELQLDRNSMFNINTIQEITQLETAEIIGNSMLIGYYTGLKQNDPNPIIVENFKKIGDICGYMFQAMNDLEAFSNPKKLYAHKGNLNSDIINNRKNIAIAFLYNIANKKDKRLLVQNFQENLQPLMKKYQVSNAMLYQLNDLFVQAKKIVKNLETENISNEWIDGFLSFLDYIKNFGEERLKM